MDERSLQKNLANLERELVNLQTAHQVGAGVVNFYEYSDSTTTSIPGFIFSTVAILVEVRDGEQLNPMVNQYSNSYLYIKASQVYPNRYEFFCIRVGSQVITWKIVSSSRLNYHYATTTAEVEEWLGEPVE